MFTLKISSLVHLIALYAQFSTVFSDDGTPDQPHCNYDGEETSTCLYQVPALNLTKECLIDNVRSKDCKDWTFQITGRNDLGEVQLIPYLTRPPTSSALNLTFLDVQWNYLRFHWKERNDGSPFCRKLVLSPRTALLDNVNLFYDCPWFNHTSEQHEFDFKYETQNTETGKIEGRYFIFQLPSNRDIDPDTSRIPDRERKLFCYLDISALPVLTVHWQQPPNITVKSYKVSLRSKDTDEDLQTKTVAANENSQQQALDFNGHGLTGRVYITVQAIFKDDSEGVISSTPIISLVPKSSYFGLYISVGIILLGATSLFIAFTWLRSEYLGESPVILILYKHASNSHAKALVAFANCLKEVTKAKVLLDEVDIPLSETKDPFRWYQDAFVLSNCILVIASPSVPAVHQESIYPNVDTVGLRLLAEKFCDRNCQRRFFSVIFPYCRDDGIPPEAVNFRRFSLMNDFRELIWYVTHTTKDGILYKPIYRLFSLFKKNTNLKDPCKPLVESFQSAHDDLRSCVSESSSSCGKQVCDIDVLKELESVGPLKINHIAVPLPDVCDSEDDVNSSFPCNISELNLLGSEGEELEYEVKSKPVLQSGFDIHELLQTPLIRNQ